MMAIREISVAELADLMAAGATVYDVRETHEWEEVRAPGTILIPLGTVPDNIDAFPTEGDVLIICRSGGRSMRACEFLAEHGRSTVNIAGGTLAWVDAGYGTESGEATS